MNDTVANFYVREVEMSFFNMQAYTHVCTSPGSVQNSAEEPIDSGFVAVVQFWFNRRIRYGRDETGSPGHESPGHRVSDFGRVGSGHGSEILTRFHLCVMVSIARPSVWRMRL